MARRMRIGVWDNLQGGAREDRSVGCEGVPESPGKETDRASMSCFAVKDGRSWFSVRPESPESRETNLW